MRVSDPLGLGKSIRGKSRWRVSLRSLRNTAIHILGANFPSAPERSLDQDAQHVLELVLNYRASLATFQNAERACNGSHGSHAGLMRFGAQPIM
jgi:hypothetical protein